MWQCRDDSRQRWRNSSKRHKTTVIDGCGDTRYVIGSRGQCRHDYNNQRYVPGSNNITAETRRTPIYFYCTLVFVSTSWLRIRLSSLPSQATH